MPDIQPLKFTEEQKRVWKANFAPQASADQWALFVDECERRALIPNTHVVFSLRNAREKDSVTGEWIQTKKVAFITTINALRLLVDRYSDAHPDRAFKGYGRFKYIYEGADDEITETAIPVGAKVPHAVTVEVYRKDWAERSLFVVARYDACAQKKFDGTPTEMWAKRGPEQLAKCCEAAALRAIAPEELGGLYLKEELEASLDQPEQPEPSTTAPAPATVPQAVVAPAVNQAPAKADLADVTTSVPAEAKALFANTTPPPKEQETRAFPPMNGPAPSITKIPDSPDTRHARAVIPLAEPAASGTHVAVPSQPVEATKPEPKPVIPTPAAQTAPTPASTPAGPKAATTAERNSLSGRISRIVRDVLPKGGMDPKKAGELFKAYFVRANGGIAYMQIPFAGLETALAAVEIHTENPQAARALVEGEQK